jgi:hypothetical protein
MYNIHIIIRKAKINRKRRKRIENKIRKDLKMLDKEILRYKNILEHHRRNMEKFEVASFTHSNVLDETLIWEHKLVDVNKALHSVPDDVGSPTLEIESWMNIVRHSTPLSIERNRLNNTRNPPISSTINEIKESERSMIKKVVRIEDDSGHSEQDSDVLPPPKRPRKET